MEIEIIPVPGIGKNKRISTITLMYKNMINQNQLWQPQGLAHRKTHFLSLFCICPFKNVAKVLWLVVFGLGVGVSGKAQSIDYFQIYGPACTGNGVPIGFLANGLYFGWPSSNPYPDIEVVDSVGNFVDAQSYSIGPFDGATYAYLPITLSPGTKKARLKNASPLVYSDSAYFRVLPPSIRVYTYSSIIPIGSNGPLPNIGAFIYGICGFLLDTLEGQLSDNNGSFSNPTLCSLDYNSCTIYGFDPCAKVLLPKGLASGNQYKFRLRANDSINSNDIYHFAIFKGEIESVTSHLCVGDSVLLHSNRPVFDINYFGTESTDLRYRWYRLTESGKDSFAAGDDEDFYARQAGKYFARIYYAAGYLAGTDFTLTDTVEIFEGPCPRFSISLEGSGQTLTSENLYALCHNTSAQVLLTGQAEYASVNDFTYQYSWDGGTWLDTLTPVDGLLSIPEWQSGLLRIRPILSSGFVPDTAETQILVLPTIHSNFAFDVTACAAKLVHLDTTTIDDPSNPGNNLVFDYTWNIAPGYSQNTLPTTSTTDWTGSYFADSTTGVHTVILTISNSTYGCSASDTVVVGIDSLSLWSYGIFGNENQPQVTQAFATGGTEPYTFAWTNIDTCLSENCDSVQISYSGNRIDVTVTDNLGCVYSDTLGVIKIMNKLCADQNTGLPDSITSLLTNSYIGDLHTADQKEFQAYVNQNKAQNKIPGWQTDELVIPIVFYVLYPDNNNAADNLITDSVIINQLQVLNNRFGGQEFKLDGKFCKIKFCLAERYQDSSGVFRPIENAVKLPEARLKVETTKPGIIYIADSTAGNKYFNNVPFLTAGYRVRQLNSISGLESSRYLKIFISNSAGSAPGGAYGAGTIFLREKYWNTIFAPDSLPYSYGHFQKFDGVNLARRLIGNSTYSPYGTGYYQQGKAVIHEIGHYFGLFHVIAPNEVNDITVNPFRCLDSSKYIGDTPLSDFVADTPPQNKYSIGTLAFEPNNPNVYNTCNPIRLTAVANEARCPNKPLPVKNNPMDYVSDVCQDTFTTGQVERMVYQLSYYRSKLISPENAAYTGVSCSPSAGFYLPKNHFCSEADSLEFPLYFNGAAVTSSTLSINMSTTKYKVVSKSADSARIRIYPQRNIPGSFTIAYHINFTGAPSGGVETSQEVYFSAGSCSPLDKTKNNMFYGQQAGLSAGNEGKLESNEAAYNARPFTKRIDAFCGGITYNHPQTGELIYYAAGKNIWNKNHKRLTTPANQLLASDSSTQYGIALPHPLDSNYSVLFTVPSNDTVSRGFRFHKIKHTGINASTATLTGSTLNIPVLMPTKYPIQRGTGSAIHVGDKITAVPKSCKDVGYWIIVQGHQADANYKNKLLIFSFDQTDTVPRFVDSCFAGGWATNGVLKASPDGTKLVSTFTNANFINGTGNGYRPKIYSFNAEKGKAKYLGRLTTNHFSDSISAYGASFTKDNLYVYATVNNAGADTGFNNYRGIYRFGIEEPDGQNYTGTKLQNVAASFANVQVMLDAFGKIVLNKYFNVGLDVFHKPSESNPLFQESGILLTNNPNKYPRSRAGLPNFVDAERYNTIPDGATLADAIDLGLNPNPCCPSPSIVNVACAGNEDLPTTTGNDIFYKFRLQKEATRWVIDTLPGGDTISTKKKVFNRDFSISFTNSDFAITPSVEFLDTNNFWKLLNMHFSSQGYGAVSRKYLSIAVNKVTGDAQTIIDFRVTLNANDTNATGNFRTYIRFASNLAGYPCCRIAVDYGDKRGENETNTPIGLVKKMRLYPNPTNGDINLEIEGKSEWYRVFDPMGRLVKTGSGFKEKTNISTAGLTTGIYRILLLGENGTESTTFEIIR